MREIITIQVGSCGNRISNDFWTNICREHSIEPNGSYSGDSNLQLQRINTYFHEEKSHQFLPRAVLIDLDSSTIDEMRISHPFGSLFGPKSSAVGRGSASSNYAKGFYSQGGEWIEYFLDVVRHQTEQCDRLQGFQMTHSLGGGTGSGMGCLLASRIKEEYPEILFQSSPVFPSQKISSVALEQYNVVLALAQLKYTDIIQIIDNEALYDICFRSLKIASPTYQDLNRLAAETMTALTCTYRFPGELNSTMRKMAMNLIPFPSAPCLAASFSELSQTQFPSSSPIMSLTAKVLHQKNFICDADPRHGRYIAATMVSRGNVTLKEVDEAVACISNKGSSILVEWIPDAFKGCLCEVPQGKWKLCGALNSNLTSIQDVLKRMLAPFDYFFRRKAFVHQYTSEGMDEMEFIDAELKVEDLISEYQRLQDATAAEEEDEWGA